MRKTKTPERKAIEKQEFVKLARNGKEVSGYRLLNVEFGAMKGEFLPSDFILIEDEHPRWVFLYKVTKLFFHELSPKEHIRRAKKEEEVVSGWIKEKKKEIKQCKDELLLKTKKEELKEYRGLLSFLQKTPQVVRKMVIEEKRAKFWVERQEKEDEERGLEMEAKVIRRIKKLLLSAIRDAKKSKMDEDGIYDWHATACLAGSYAESERLMLAIRSHVFTPADIDLITQEMFRKAPIPFENTDGIVYDDFWVGIGTKIFERFFGSKLGPTADKQTNLGL